MAENITRLSEADLQQIETDSIRRAEKFGIDISSIAEDDLPQLNFLGEPLDPRRSMAIAIEAKITSLKGQKIERERIRKSKLKPNNQPSFVPDNYWD